MNFFKKLFGVAKEEKTPTVEELQRADEKNFDILKFDGVKALKINSVGYAIECFTHALNIKEDLEVRDYLSQAYVGVGDYNNAVSATGKAGAGTARQYRNIPAYGRHCLRDGKLCAHVCLL